MESAITTVLTFVCSIIGYLFGQRMGRRLPHGYMEKDHPRDVLMAATGMIATLVALVLGLLVSSAKNTYDKSSDAISEGGAKIIELDRVLRQFGPEALPARIELREFVTSAIERIGKGVNRPALNGPPGGQVHPITIDELMSHPVRKLVAHTEEQKEQRAQAMGLVTALSDNRWQMIERASSPLPMPFLILLYFWLAVLFTGFGLLAPGNGTFFAAFAICALSMAGAVYLIHEMNEPLDGTLRVSPAPLQIALRYLDI